MPQKILTPPNRDNETVFHSFANSRYTAPMRVLLVEDDEKIAEFVRKGLKQSGFVVDRVSSAEEALAVAGAEGFDAAIVDIMLPGQDGLSFIERLRARGIETPILILSARRSVDDRVRGLQTGGDDYLVKPFSFTELLARLQALIRRSTRTGVGSKLQVGEVILDMRTHTVTREGQDIELQPREFMLLEYLMRNEGTVLSRTMILEHVWNYEFDPQTNVVDVLVSRLRSKVDKGFSRNLIHTIRGIGYVFKA
ncbi:MAG: response regulator transcription factor [Spirochaetaceae bacterium]